MLPDVVGGRVTPEFLKTDLSLIAAKAGVEFIKGEIRDMYPDRKVFDVTGRDISYEYAVLATGSETNFYDKNDLKNKCLKLDDVDDAVSIKESILRVSKNTDKSNILIIGGGYTGIEIATNIAFLFKRERRKCGIYIVETSDEILKMIPEWMRTEIKNELKDLGIQVICGDNLDKYDNETAVLGSGKTFDDAVTIWAAGVKTPGFLSGTGFKTERSRISVDERLCPAGIPCDGVFIAGDTASFTNKHFSVPLRMAVMFSMGQGKIAADNIINDIKGKPYVKYTPVDLGYLIPMAHGKAPGIVAGVKIHGVTGYYLHYIMCLFRSEQGNKTGVFRDIF